MTRNMALSLCYMASSPQRRQQKVVYAKMGLNNRTFNVNGNGVSTNGNGNVYTVNGDAYQNHGKNGYNIKDPEDYHSKGSGRGRMPGPQDEAVVDEEEACGWGRLSPRCCQQLRSPKLMLFWLCCAGAIQGMIVNGFVSVVISTIEKRFDLASTESGIIASSYDAASVICLIPVSYFGGQGHKPRWLGMGILIMSLGSLVFTLPHFTTGPYQYEDQEVRMCMTDRNATDVCVSKEQSASYLSNYKYVLILGQVMHGIGATPLYTLGVTYLDENLKPKMTPVYVGIFYAMAIVGPAIGYLAGGQFLRIFTDVGLSTGSSTDYNPDSPTFVGAWWIGFLLSGFLGLIVAFPLSGFPKRLPGAAELQANRVSEAYKGSDNKTSKPGFGSGARDIPSSLRILLLNPTFMFLNLAGASEGLLLSGFTAFTPKFVQSQFSVSATWAAMCVGLATIPAGGGGTFLGGYLVRKLELKCAGIIKLCLVSTVTSLILLFVFFVQCPNTKFAGISVDYQNNNRTPKVVGLQSSCNANCSCLYEAYNPVCGVDNVMYYSPCHAGCEGKATMDEGKVFENCSCVAVGDDFTLPYMAKEGQCESDCFLLYIFLPVFALVIFFTFITSMPALSGTLRCVSEKQKSFALGIQWILVRCLGTIPAPIVFGALIDLTCSLWQKSCDGSHGSCYLYDNKSMGMYLLILALSGKVLSLLFFSLALLLYKAPPKEEVDQSTSFDDISKSTTTMNTVMTSESLCSEAMQSSTPISWYNIEQASADNNHRVARSSGGESAQKKEQIGEKNIEEFSKRTS